MKLPRTTCLALALALWGALDLHAGQLGGRTPAVEEGPPIAAEPRRRVVVSDFQGTAPAANLPWTRTSFLASGVGFSGWDLADALVPEPSIDDALGFSVNAPGGVLAPLSEALAQDEYLGISLAPEPGSRLDLGGARVRFSIQRHAWHAPLAYAVFSSVEGFGLGDELFRTTPVAKGDYGEHRWAFFIPQAGYDGLESGIELRIYAFEAEWGGHETSLTRFRVVTGVEAVRLTLVAEPGGSVAADPASELYVRGQTVEVSATPDPGYRFAGWAGGVKGPGVPRSLLMDRDRTVRARFDPRPAPGMEVGTNLPSVEDWNTAWQFSDLFHRARTWMTRNHDGSGPWNSNLQASIPTDPEGWPTQVPFAPGGRAPLQIVHTIFSRLDDAGSYTLFFEGTGALRVGTTNVSASGGRQSHSFSAGSAGVQLPIEIHQSASPDHVRNLQLVHESQLATYQLEPFHPLYLQRLQPFSLLRFMDWGKTNNSPLMTWSARTLEDHYTQTRPQGAALEWMISLSNRLGRDAWICIPHRADDDFVRRAARLLRDGLDPSLRVWVEYSNETWNWQFTQASFIQARGIELRLDPDDFTAMHEFHSRRSVDIWRIFGEEFGAAASTRVVKVLPAQSAWSTIAQLRIGGLLDLENNPELIWPDVLATAPYFGFNFTVNEIPPIAAAYPTVEWIVDVLAPQQIAATRGGVQSHRAIADAQGLPLVCYEGGQHFVGSAPANNDPLLVQILEDVNRDPRMYSRYIEYLDMLEAEGVELLVHFSYCDSWGKYGSWGALEVQDQALSAAPKYRALTDWIGRR